MASVFKPVGRAKYVILYTDEQGRRRKKTGASDKTVTQRIARDIENRVALRREGVVDSKSEGYVSHEARPLADHLADWLRDMQAKAKTPKHAEQFHDRAGKLAALVRGARLSDIEPGRKGDAQERGDRKLSETLRSARLSDLTPERIQSALASLREAGKAHQTVNHYRAALRAFARWAGDKGRLRDNPMRGVSGFNAEEDVRHARRSLTDDELARLVRAAETGPDVFGMPGPLRAMAYRVAAGTGFRVAELRALTPSPSDWTVPSLTSSSAPARRRIDDRPSNLSRFRSFETWPIGSATSRPGCRSCPFITRLPRPSVATWKRPGFPMATDEGMADFHSLRAYYISALVRSGATIKEVQTLARHAKPRRP